MTLHELQHFRRNVMLWRLNHRLARRAIRHELNEQYQDYTISVAKNSDLKTIEHMHAQLFRQPLLGWLSWVYRFNSPKLITIAKDKSNTIVGYECFMFNACEVKDNIIHEVYIGVLEPHQGKGLASAMRKCSINSYNFGNLSAISTVALTNDIKALRSAQYAGFAIEKQSAKPPGHYLVKHLTMRD